MTAQARPFAYSNANAVNVSGAGKAARSFSAPPATWGSRGLVSKHRERRYRAGRQPHWIKVKNRTHPAFVRVQESFK
jgi:ATP-dependent DNA ligase